MTAQNINKYQKTVAQGYVYGRESGKEKKKKTLCTSVTAIALWPRGKQADIDFENVNGGGTTPKCPFVHRGTAAFKTPMSILECIDL